MLATSNPSAKPQPPILAVDDNPANRRLLRLQLTALGYAADIAESGAEALQRWQSGDYRLVFTDLHMPGIDGFKLTAAIRGMERSETPVPIYALTASASPEDIQRALVAGINGWLIKPVGISDMESLLHRVIPKEAHSALTH